MIPPSVEAGLGSRERRWLLAFLILGSAYFAVLLLQQLTTFFSGFSSLLLVLFLAWLMAFVMAPLVRALEGLSLPRGLAATLAYLVALVALGALLFGLVSAITEQVRQVTASFPETAAKIQDTLRSWEQTPPFSTFGINLVEVFQSLQSSLGSVAGAIFAQAQAIAGATIGAIGSFVLVLILSLYMVMDSERILSRINRIVPRRYNDELEIFERTVERAFGGFLRAQLILVVFQAVLVVAI